MAPFVLDLEENIGLDLLFSLRGTRQAPPEVVVVSIDKESAQHLNLPNDPRKWPRSHHARLIENLIKQGAAVIAFDIIFDETKSAEDDQLFSEVIRKANNVVLCEYIKREKIPLSGKGGSQGGSLDIEKLVAPIPPLAKAAVALAPFPLPKIPIRVNQYWTFKTEAGDTPTLPVVVFQVYAMGVYDEFIHLLRKVSPSQAEKLPHDKEVIITSRNIENVIREIRSLFEEEPLLGEKMLKELENSRFPSVDIKKTQILKSLIKMYQSAKSRFLNFYGPPGTIITVSYSKFWNFKKKHVQTKAVRFRWQSCIYWTFGTLPIRTERRFLYGFLRIEWIRSKRGRNCCNCICQSYRGKTSSANQFLGTPHRPFPLGSGDRHRLLLPSHSYCSRGRHRAECGLFRIFRISI